MCYHNSLYCLSAATLAWKELFSTSKTSGPMRKDGTALLPFNGQLLAVAGKGPETPINPSHMAKYSKWNESVYTNEHQIFNREKGEQPISLSGCAFVCFKNKYSILDGWIKSASSSIFTIIIEHFFGSHDQYSTLGGSHMTNIEHLESCDEYHTLFELVKLHNKHSYHTLLCIYWGNTFSGFCRWIQVGWRCEVAVFTGTSFRWLLSVSNNLLIAWFSIPSWIHPRKNYISIKAQKGLLYAN